MAGSRFWLLAADRQLPGLVSGIPGGAASRPQYTRCKSWVLVNGSQSSTQYALPLAGCLIYRAPFGGWEFGLRSGSGLVAAVAIET